MTYPAVLLDKDGRISAMNQRAAEKTETTSPDHVTGLLWSQLWPSEIEEIIDQSVRDAAMCGKADLTAGCRAGPGDGVILDMEITARDGLIFVTMSDATEAWRRGDRPQAHVARSLRIGRLYAMQRVA
ncbi:PAS domain-containing protein [Aestuariibius insulae]|uniref:PAS domain-containing protein n=1 Tax=Aestuariibius insulae TaxID=2058287 RepID=UPI00345EE4B9